MFKTGYKCPICGSTDTVLYDGGGCNDIFTDGDEYIDNDSEDMDLQMECLMCGYLFVPEE